MSRHGHKEIERCNRIAAKMSDREHVTLLLEVLWAIIQKNGGEIRLTQKERCSTFEKEWEIATMLDPLTHDTIIKSRVRPCQKNQ